MKIAVVTDSTAYLTEQQVKDHHLFVVPIPVILDGQVYDEGVDITTEEFYQKLKTSETFPSTSQPPLGEMLKLYEDLGNEGYDAVISIHLASTISGFVTTLKNAASTIDNIQVVPYDSGITVMLMGYLAMEAARMARDPEVTVDQIIARLDDLKSTMDECFIVNDLQNLVRGGRLSNASAFIGSMLKIKPLLTFDADTNKITAFEKVRSLKKAYARAEQIFAETAERVDYPLRALIIHANDEPAAIAWRDKLQANYPDLPIDISYFGPVIGTHLGEKAIALAWIKDFDKA
ncbi:DegV family protein [Latilactobacillus curvatus]|jgi:DegV family protein with EDD domain|uniref:DegV family protein n=2 Tax=Latilactobacillus curvatus TaxID=28038 RepID=A0A0B2XLH5_LATCU|nr:DegV family protein [Latilactobacillus curvatus]ANJ69338.1 fatty acid-binding protein DegV [Latilactobacillus curvatus]AOO75525.1 fatty acid-binding protein DegV [Latilactobacillus curvatus]ASN60174.1 DegV family protein [Latilactobacillus curvatus]AWV72980.1 DegV family protein [Latilactobacillus curvatus]AXN35880.1 DegV family protein [Latilactobacillus curvatus]